MRRIFGMMAAAAALAAAGVPTAAAATPGSAAADEEQVEEIVVTGRRSGVPIWRVTGPAGSIVLVGSIRDISKSTKWDPEPLAEAVRKADRVTFPEGQAFTASPFSMIGWLAKWRAMSSLPKGDSLARYVDAETMKRLEALRARGLGKKDFERRHPLHLALDLQDDARGDLDVGRSVLEHVQRTARRHKLEIVPVPESKAKPVIKDLFASSPAEHVPCLAAAIAMAEAGPEAVQARSDAWAARDIPAVLSSPADKPYLSCWPATEIAATTDEVAAAVRPLLDSPEVTLAVLSLRSLAAPGGVLDRLEAEGFDIEGPAWRE